VERSGETGRIIERVVAQREGPRDWTGESAFSQRPGQVRRSVKEALQFSGPVSAAQLGPQQDAWQGSWVELQLGNDGEQSYKASDESRQYLWV
jgi:hypothetical protein